jgi:hypothetical protein
MEGAYNSQKFRGMTPTPCFYIVEPTLCPDLQLIKIGKAQNIELRLSSYANHWDGHFNVLRLVTFRKLDKDKNINGVSDFASKFESRVKKVLKEKGLKPARGCEFYHTKDLQDILLAMVEVDEESREQKHAVEKNRRSSRIAREQYFDVERLVKRAVRKADGKRGFIVKFVGYDEPEFVEQKILNEDVPEMVKEFNNRKNDAKYTYM